MVPGYRSGPVRGQRTRYEKSLDTLSGRRSGRSPETSSTEKLGNGKKNQPIFPWVIMGDTRPDVTGFQGRDSQQTPPRRLVDDIYDRKVRSLAFRVPIQGLRDSRCTPFGRGSWWSTFLMTQLVPYTKPCKTRDGTGVRLFSVR